jgi:NAD(P)-dependent dehydrogenase (short-subunit alcohol dehydrogenase family)
MRFENKVVLITGGTQGIGFATARLFAAEGARVVIVGRDGDKTTEAARKVSGRGEAGDVSIPAECERIVTRTFDLFGHLDLLVNCAGVIFRNRTIEQTSEEEWDKTFDVNVKGTFLMSKYALPALRETKGCIVNMSSYVGLVGFAGTSAYAASKAAIINLTRSMALDHAKEGIRVNAICPGSVDTEMIRSAWEKFGDVEQARKLWNEKHPLGRIATADEVGRVIQFLASEDASFITGAAIPVYGGITAG